MAGLFCWEGKNRMTKQELIELIQELPDDLQAFGGEQGQYDDRDITIFTKPKDKEFLEWYFGP